MIGKAGLLAVISCLLALSNKNFVRGWTLEDLRETRCRANMPPTAGNLDQAWLGSVPLWYYNHGSKFDMYRTSAEILKVNVTEIKDADLYYRACFKCKFGGETSYVDGFGGKRYNIKTVMHENGAFDWLDEDGGVTGTSSMPFTDNKSYVFFYACWADGFESWGILATKPELDERTLIAVHEHAKSFGFRPEYFTHIEYHTCEKEGTKKTQNLADEP